MGAGLVWMVYGTPDWRQYCAGGRRMGAGLVWIRVCVDGS
jgi:hypothetical protein